MIKNVIVAAIEAALDRMPPHAMGLRSCALPTETDPQACVAALQEVVQRRGLANTFVVIGTSNPQAVKVDGRFMVLPSDAAAAQATRVRSEEQCRANSPLLLYFNSNSTPGENGLDVLVELTRIDIAEAFAVREGLPTLKELAQSRSRAVRDRILDASIEDLGRYATLAKKHSEVFAAPVLGLLLDGRKGKVSAAATAFDGLAGRRTTEGLTRAKEFLKALSESGPEVANAALGARFPELEELPGTATQALTKLCENAIAYSRDPGADPDGLCGLTNPIARLLRGGEAAIKKVLENQPPPPPPPGELRPETDVDLVAQQRGDQLKARLASYEHEGEWYVGVGSEPDDIALKRNGRIWILDVAKKHVGVDGWLYGSALRATNLQGAPNPSRATILDISKGEEAVTACPEALAVAKDEFLAARTALVKRIASLAPSSAERDETLWQNSGQAGPNYEWICWLAEGFPLLLCAQMPAEIDQYIEKYAGLLQATFSDRSTVAPVLKQWLVNLDLIISVEGSQVMAAWMLPLHPFRLIHARLWLGDGQEPPPLPTTLAVHYSAEEDLQPSANRYGFARWSKAPPSAVGLALAASDALRGAWGLLCKKGLLGAMSVELIDISSPEPIIDALCDEGQRLLDEDADVRGLHLEVRFTFSEPVYQDAVRLAISSELSTDSQEALRTSRGIGLSLTLGQAVLQAIGQLSHVAIQAVPVPVVPLAGDGITPAHEMEIVYRPMPIGTIGAVEYRGLPVLDGYARLLEDLSLPVGVRGLSPTQMAPELGGALVKSFVSRRGWPISPTQTQNLLSHSEAQDHVVATIVDRDVFDALVAPGLRAVSRASGDLDLDGIRRGIIAMSDCRYLLRNVLEDADVRHSRGALGKLRAFNAVRASTDVKRTLVLSFDATDARLWVKVGAEVFKSSASRADLLIVEANESLTDIECFRVAELKSGNYRSGQDLGPLAEQALLAAARVRAAFAGKEADQGHHVLRETLRRFLWFGAGAQLKAKEWEVVLRAIDAKLRKGDPIPVTAECWIVPEHTWDGDLKQERDLPTLSPNGTQLVEQEKVLFRVLDAADDEDAPEPPTPGPGQGVVGLLATGPASARTGPEVRPVAAPPSVVADEVIAIAVSQPEARATPIQVAGASLSVSTEVADASQSEPDADGQRIRIGSLRSGADAVWLPNRTDLVLHFNVGITGTMGTGKTQLTKALLAQLIRTGSDNVGGVRPGILVFDYKGDYKDSVNEAFASLVGASVHEAIQLPINPLKPTKPQGRRDFALAPQVFADTLRAIDSRIGPVQRNQVITAVKECYRTAGIDENNPATWGRRFPTLYDLSKHLEEHKLAEGVPQAIIGDLVALEVFANEDPKDDLDEFFDGVNVISLTELRGSPTSIRAILCFFMNAFRDRMVLRGETALERRGGNVLRRLDRFILVDEADDFLGLDLGSLKDVMQQGRSFGHGVILSTQYLHHFNRADTPIRPLVGTWLLHQMRDLNPTDVKALFALASKDEVNRHVSVLGNLPQHTSLCVGLSNPEAKGRAVEVKDLPFKNLPRVE